LYSRASSSCPDQFRAPRSQKIKCEESSWPKAQPRNRKESKCRGSSAPLEGRDWVRIGGNKWLREVAEKQGKYISKEYREKSGRQFEEERAHRAAEAEKAALVIVREEAREELQPEDEAVEEHIDGTYGESAVVPEE
jgi:hypothetical protein